MGNSEIQENGNNEREHNWAHKTEKRVGLLKEISDIIINVNFLGKGAPRNRDENPIQQAIFMDLKEKLPELISDSYGLTVDHLESTVDDYFVWEGYEENTMHNFSFFATNHRPDAFIKLPDDTRIGIEIKKGKKGHSLRSGIGQSIVYASQFDFVLYIFIDTTDGLNIKSSSEGEKEKLITNELWDNFNIKFFVI